MPKMLPLQINALHLTDPIQVIGQDIRFENIPWMNKDKGVFENPNTPLETNSIIPRPFSYDNAIYLEMGMHLHFVLPSYFKKFNENGSLPSAPNRWYIRREVKKDKNNNILIEEKEWIIESDYIWNVNDPNLIKSSTCTYVEGKKGEDLSFKYVGKKYLLKDWLKKENDVDYQEYKNLIKKTSTIDESERQRLNQLNIEYGSKYLNNLTAIGWGAMSFDVHYPNCRSVFGFHDIDGNNECEYFIIGWIDKVREIKNEESNIIVAGKFSFDKNDKELGEINLDISIANSMQETLVAFLTEKNIKTDNDIDKIKLEEQIESVLNFDELNDHNLDWVSRLRIKRHEKQFNRIPGTTKFVVDITDKENKIIEYSIDLSSITRISGKEISKSENEIFKNFKVFSVGDVVDFEFVKLLFEQYVGKFTSKKSKFEPIEELYSLNRLLNTYELESFRLNTELESLYIHWSTYLNALFVSKEKNINKLKRDLNLLVSQIKKLKIRVENFEGLLETSRIKFISGISELYQNHLDFQILVTLLDLNQENVDESKSKLIDLNNKKVHTKINLSKISKTDYYEQLPPSVILSTDNENELFKLFSEKVNSEKIDLPKGLDLNNLWRKDSIDKLYTISEIKKNVTLNEWSTYKIEWEASFLPKKEGHYNTNSGAFDEDFIESAYNLEEQSAELVKKNGIHHIGFMPNSNNYYGNSFVTDKIKRHVLDLLDENKSKVEAKVNKDIINVIDESIANLKNSNILELTLSDFNNQLLQRSNALTVLPLIPNGFDDHKLLAKEIADLLTYSKNEKGSAGSASKKNELNLLTPNKSAVFNPFRNGAFRLNSLRIVDSFGRNKIIEPTKIITTQHQTIKYKPQWIELPPRYLQPASVDIDFDMTDTGDSTSPVIGWMVPIYLTQKLEFFDANGKHLGSLDNTGNWESSPFEITIAEKNENYNEIVKNPHLERIINWFSRNILKEGNVVNKKFMSDFIKNIQEAMNNCFPEDNSNPSLLETISTIPIAITLVNINLYTKGEALFDLNCDDKISINTYDNQRQYDRVKMPMSIGDMSQYNDGVLGYWHCNLDSYYKEMEFSNDVIMPELDDQIYFDLDNLSSKAIDKAISSKRDDRYNYLRLNENRNSCQRYILMHPKGNLSVKTGFLPVSSIKIPYDQIKNALKKIELTLLVAPILTNKDTLEISLSKDSRYRWSWIELHKTIKNEKLSSESNIPIKKRITQDLAIELKQGQFNRYKKFFDENEFLIYDENQNDEENIFYVNEEKWMELLNKNNKEERELEIVEMLKNNLMSIPHFNVTKPSNSKMVLKEGWLSIKSTKI